MAWVLSPYPHLSQITTIWVAHYFLTCRHLKQCRCHCHGDSLCSTPQHTLQPLSCNMLFRFPLGGLQHTRPHTWFWCIQSSPVQQLQLPLSSVKPFYPNSMSLPLSEVARIHVAVCHLKNSVAILEPLPVAYIITLRGLSRQCEVICAHYLNWPLYLFPLLYMAVPLPSCRPFLQLPT